jgi:ABC-2 type transport system ATP-binding protein
MLGLQTRDLGRSYQRRDKKVEIRALEGISLDVEVGEVHGLLGPNGAGKTTLVKILSTVLLPTAGSASVMGHDVVRETAAVRPLIGIVFGGDRGLYTNLTGRQNLAYWAALYNIPAKETRARVERLLERVGLAERADDLTQTYSRGMKQRLHLARGLVGQARVLFLDEPTIGMDPLAARDFRRLVNELRAEGRTILITTHDMAEAEAVCDRVALIDHGRLLAVETPRTLAQIMAKHERIDFEGPKNGLVDDVRRLRGVAAVSGLPEGNVYRIELSDGAATHRVLAFLVGAGVTSIRTSRPSLEEVYVHMIGDRGLRV